MSSTIKTKVNDSSVEDFINGVEGEVKRQDAFTLLEIYQRLTDEPAKMWGTSIIGFGQYHYKSERSDREKDSRDFKQVAPNLGQESRDWLISSLQLVHPGHSWLSQL